MESSDAPRLDRYTFILLPIMALAFYIAFIPHQSYPYPVHIDDWIHLANAQAILKAGSVDYIQPFYGDSVVKLGSNLEIGFQLFWAIFHQVSGISWLTIFRFFPGIVMVITVLSAYVLGQRHGFGWEAALFAAIIPTTVGILGPAFLVPVAMGLSFVCLSLFVALNLKGIWSYLVQFVLICFLLAIHAPSAIVAVIILVPYLLVNIRKDFKHVLGTGVALLLPFIGPFPWILRMLAPTAGELFTRQALPDYIDFPRIIRSYGYIPIALCLLGTLALAFKGGRRNYSLVLGLLALLAMLVAFYAFHYGVSIMYERGLVFMMLMVGLVAGAGLMTVKNIHLPERWQINAGLTAISRYSGWFFCLVLVGLTLYTTLPDRQQEPYYQMMTDDEYRAYTWIKENVGEEYQKAILDPWKATPFAVISGKYVYTRIHAYPTPVDEEARKFLEDGCRDTAFLKAKSITIVYTDGKCENPDLSRVRDNVYLLKK